MTVLALVLAASTLAYEVPDGWEPVAPSSGMRIAQWSLPGEADDGAEAVIFYFGEGQGGGVDANLARWFGQFEQPDGTSTKDRAKIAERDLNGLKLTIADMRGTYVASVRPGSRARNHRPGYRMIAAVVEGTGGPWYVRVLGPDGNVVPARVMLVASDGRDSSCQPIVLAKPACNRPFRDPAGPWRARYRQSGTEY